MSIDFRWDLNGKSDRMASHEVQLIFASEQHWRIALQSVVFAAPLQAMFLYSFHLAKQDRFLHASVHIVLCDVTYAVAVSNIFYKD